jgi:fatty acid desaturase
MSRSGRPDGWWSGTSCFTCSAVASSPAPRATQALPPLIPQAKARLDLAALFGVQAVLLVAISLAASPLVYVGLYFLPLAMLTAGLESVRSFSEHVLPGTATCDAEENRRFFMDAGPVERFFVSQFDFHYHHVHHLHPNVVTFKVRRLHAWLSANDPGYPQQFIVRPGYVATAVRYIFNKPFQGAGLGYPFQPRLGASPSTLQDTP